MIVNVTFFLFMMSTPQSFAAGFQKASGNLRYGPAMWCCLRKAVVSGDGKLVEQYDERLSGPARPGPVKQYE